MGFLSKINRARKKATSAVTKPFVKAASKISQKFIPNELRFLAPYAAGIGTLMLPPGMGPLARGLAGAGFNALGQIGADESEIDDISDLNALSMALSGGLGALGSNKVSGAMNKGIETGALPDNVIGGATGPSELGMTTRGPGFLQGAENVGRSGIAAASDYVTGGRENLVNLGRNPGNLFSSADKFEGARNAMSALGPTVSLATGDVAYEDAVDRKLAADALDLEEQAEFDSTNKATDSNRASLQMTSMRQAGIPEDTVVETLEMNGLGEYYTPPTEEAAYGGLMGRNDYEFGGIIDAIKNIESREMMDQNKNMGGMMNSYNMGGSVLPQGMEMDYRQGGFIPMGSKERADDVPARVSKNEFVMTADAVRAAGGGSVNQGAKKMYDLMNNLEAKA